MHNARYFILGPSIMSRQVALKQEVKVFILHLTLLVISLLPISAQYFFIDKLARWHHLFFDYSAAVAKIIHYFPERHQQHEALGIGLAKNQLLDYLDCYLSLFRGKRWVANNICYRGPDLTAIAQSGPGLFFTLHYGQGIWALKKFKLNNIALAWLYLGVPKLADTQFGNYLFTLMLKFRVKQIEKITQAKPIPTGGSVSVMQERLIQQKSFVMVMPDAPLSPEQSSVPVQLLGRKARIAKGSLALAVREGVPVYLYTIAYNAHTKKRALNLQGPFFYENEQLLAQALADILSKALVENPCNWYLWEWVDSFFINDEITE